MFSDRVLDISARSLLKIIGKAFFYYGFKFTAGLYYCHSPVYKEGMTNLEFSALLILRNFFLASVKKKEV